MPNIKEVVLGNIIPKDAICTTQENCILLHLRPEAINRYHKIFPKKVIARINDNRMFNVLTLNIINLFSEHCESHTDCKYGEICDSTHKFCKASKYYTYSQIIGFSLQLTGCILPIMYSL